jgi:hypothetical protein
VKVLINKVGKSKKIYSWHATPVIRLKCFFLIIGIEITERDGSTSSEGSFCL